MWPSLRCYLYAILQSSRLLISITRTLCASGLGPQLRLTNMPPDSSLALGSIHILPEHAALPWNTIAVSQRPHWQWEACHAGRMLLAASSAPWASWTWLAPPLWPWQALTLPDLRPLSRCCRFFRLHDEDEHPEFMWGFGAPAGFILTPAVSGSCSMSILACCREPHVPEFGSWRMAAQMEHSTLPIFCLSLAGHHTCQA